MKYLSINGTLYGMPEKKWTSVCVIAAEEGKSVPQVIDERFSLKPLGEVTNVTNWTPADATHELVLMRTRTWVITR
ncbi:hypothetical protein [Ramlibacter tataouinensis]|nr:hypothetical protein [Ramlibacter tataouinensis]